MTTLTVTRRSDKFYIWCLGIGQLLTLISSFLWNDNGRHSVDASTLIVLSMVFWAAGFGGLFKLFEDNTPWYAKLGFVYAIYGCIGGVAFGMEGIFSIIFHDGDKIGVEAQRLFPTQLNLVLFWAGPAFPLSLIIMGIMMLVKKVTSPWVGIMFIIAGIGFPVSRILRIEWIAVVDDVMLLGGIVMHGWPGNKIES